MYFFAGLFAGIFGFTTGTSFMTVAYLLAALFLMLYFIIKWLYNRYHERLAAFWRRIINWITAANQANAVENIAAPQAQQNENNGNNNQLSIFTVRRVPGPEPIRQEMGLQYIV